MVIFRSFLYVYQRGYGILWGSLPLTWNMCATTGVLFAQVPLPVLVPKEASKVTESKAKAGWFY